VTRSKTAIAVGEAMIEMAPVGDGLYRHGFAGDTFNTAWHMAMALGDAARVGFVTRVGHDNLSEAFISELHTDGLDTAGIGRDDDRSMGLYLIELDGVERSFSYWRNEAAARRLADDPVSLSASIRQADQIHLSGITVAILSPKARANLIDALGIARSRGAVVSFDPNIRPALWSSVDEIRSTIPDFLHVTDIALPSFDDESAHWGDATPGATLDRFRSYGVAEVAIKDGNGPVLLCAQGQTSEIQTPCVADIRDTTGAGDAFNAGYLAARLLDIDPATAVAHGQKMAATTICHFGARIPKNSVPSITPVQHARS